MHAWILIGTDGAMKESIYQQNSVLYICLSFVVHWSISIGFALWALNAVYSTAFHSQMMLPVVFVGDVSRWYFRIYQSEVLSMSLALKRLDGSINRAAVSKRFVPREKRSPFISPHWLVLSSVQSVQTPRSWTDCLPVARHLKKEARIARRSFWINVFMMTCMSENDDPGSRL